MKGEIGYAGRDGEKGDKGESGVQGFPGAAAYCPPLNITSEKKGERGFTGEQGLRGELNISLHVVNSLDHFSS